jgi:hypothetical protein
MMPILRLFGIGVLRLARIFSIPILPSFTARAKWKHNFNLLTSVHIKESIKKYNEELSFEIGNECFAGAYGVEMLNQGAAVNQKLVMVET